MGTRTHKFAAAASLSTHAGLVPVPMVPDLMRAAGFYPSNAAIADIMHHIGFVAHAQDMDKLHHIDLETFLMLYR